MQRRRRRRGREARYDSYLLVGKTQVTDVLTEDLDSVRVFSTAGVGSSHLLYPGHLHVGCTETEGYCPWNTT